MWKIVGMFLFGETVGPLLNEIGRAIGNRAARKIDPEGAELERLAVLSQAIQSGLIGTDEPEPEPEKKRKRK